MREGTQYAKRVKQLYNRMRRQYGKPAIAELTDPTEQLITAILSRGTSQTRAQAALGKIRQAVVDLNELRVTPPGEIVDVIGPDFPQAHQKATDIAKALNDVFERQHSVSLEALQHMSRREARSYLESLAGVDPCSAASVVLYSLGGHAVPVDDDMLKYLRKEELIDPRAEIGEVQGFLERHVPAADAQAFATLLRRCVTSRLPRRRLTRTVRKEKSRARANKKPTREASRKTSARRKRRGASRR